MKIGSKNRMVRSHRLLSLVPVASVSVTVAENKTMLKRMLQSLNCSIFD
jgi:hypothetical protein